MDLEMTHLILETKGNAPEPVREYPHMHDWTVLAIARQARVKLLVGPCG